MYAGRSLAWWSPDPRGIIPLDGFHCSRSLRRAIGGFEIRVDTAFVDVMLGCADPRRPHGWINDSLRRRVHAAARVGLGALGGGVARRRARRRSVRRAHRSLLRGRVDVPPRHRCVEGRVSGRRSSCLKLDGATLFDVQWTTPHLRSLGAVDVERAEYLRLLASARMEPVQIFHNPSCSKSRGALEILEERGVDADVVRYLDAPPDRATLERILDAIPDEPIALVRTGDAKFKAPASPRPTCRRVSR